MEYVAVHSIHFRAQVSARKLAPVPPIIVPAGEKFDPAAIGMSENEVLKLLARRYIVTPEQHEAELERLRNLSGKLMVNGRSINTARRVLKPQ